MTAVAPVTAVLLWELKWVRLGNALSTITLLTLLPYLFFIPEGWSPSHVWFVAVRKNVPDE
jgi:hypothetical protein